MREVGISRVVGVLVGIVAAILWAMPRTARGAEIFVTNANSGTIGEYSSSGATLNTTLVSGVTDPQGIVVSGSNLFVVNNGNFTIGEYTVHPVRR